MGAMLEDEQSKASVRRGVFIQAPTTIDQFDDAALYTSTYISHAAQNSLENKQETLEDTVRLNTPPRFAGKISSRVGQMLLSSAASCT